MSYVNNSEHYNNAERCAQVPAFGLSQPDAPAKLRRKLQGAAVRAEIVSQIEVAQAKIAHLEAGAGPKLAKEIDTTKIIERAVDQHRLRQMMKMRLLSQRAGLFKLCNAESSNSDFDQPTERVRLYFDHMLSISANIGAVSGTGWPAAWGWFRDRLPLPSDRIGAKVLETQFDVLLAQATAKIAGRPILRLWDLHTSPSAKALAETFGTTMAQLRAAKATKCQLTAIDAPTKKERDRQAQEAKRRAAGMKSQADRKVQERDRELAVLAGVSESWVHKLRLRGRLADFLASKGLDVLEADSARNNRSPIENKKRHFQALHRNPGASHARQIPMTLTGWAGRLHSRRQRTTSTGLGAYRSRESRIRGLHVAVA